MNEELSELKKEHQVDSVPLLKDLYKHITPRYAADWKVIGSLLDIPSEVLKTIEGGYPTNLTWCCNRMLETWLEKDPKASWGKLFTAIESDAVTAVSKPFDNYYYSPDKNEIAMKTLTDRVRGMNKQTLNDEELWPPEMSKVYTPLLFIYYQGQRDFKQSTVMAEHLARGHVDDFDPSTSDELSLEEALVASKRTKKISDVLFSLESNTEPQFILIEGAPGVGKSLLLKEIADKWKDKQLLGNFVLVLLVCLRDPEVQQLSSTSDLRDLLQLFLTGDHRASDFAEACSIHILRNEGKNVVFLFDGYDEYPENLQRNSLIAKIIMRKLLPKCGLIISSRPHASGKLHNKATVKVDILGFAETERKHYIKTAMEGRPKQEIEEITQYLHQHSTISSLCYIPFNIVALLYLYKQKIPLPKNGTELYNHFICLTICRHLTKHGQNYCLENKITNLTNLPEPCNKIIWQLSKFSLEALNSNQLIFTLDQFKTACPNSTIIPGALNGFGLLQAVQHDGLNGRSVTLNFLHLSVQEFLAAHYITTLPSEKELEIIKEKLWSNDHLNMFSMYAALAKTTVFKKFLSDKDNIISSKFLDDHVKCFYLYRCFHEAGATDICDAIEQSKLFKTQKINLGYTRSGSKPRLTACDMECVTVFLTSSSNKNWLEVSFSYCCIQDCGLWLLHRGLLQSTEYGDVTITKLKLDYNKLTKPSSSLVSKIAIHCKVKELKISGNDTIGEDIYSVLTDNSVLEVLAMNRVKLSSSAAKNIFKALKDNKTLKTLEVEDAGITDDVCNEITAALEQNKCLAELYLRGDNPITGETISSVLKALKSNSTLEWLFLPKFYQDIKNNIKTELKVINVQRKNQGFQVMLKII